MSDPVDPASPISRTVPGPGGFPASSSNPPPADPIPADPPSDPPPAPRSWRGVLIAAGAVLVAVGVSAGTFLFLNRPIEQPPPPPNEPPSVVLAIDVASAIATAPAKFKFTASARDSDGTIAGYSWEYGNGPMDGTDTQTLTYKKPGVATVTVTVTDDAGATATASTTVTITEPPYPRTHVKKWGTLYGIAYRLCNGDGSRWTEIRDLNGADPHALQEGDELKLPLDCRSDLPSLPIDTERYYTVASNEAPATDTHTASVVPASNASSIASASQLDHESQVMTLDYSQISASLDYVSDHVSFAGLELAPVQIVTISSLPVSDYVAPAPSVSASIVRDAPFAVHWYETTG